MSYLHHVCGPMKFLDSLPPSSAAVTISQVEGQTFNLGTEKNVKSSGGQIYATFSGILFQAPRFAGITEALGQFIASLGIEGKILTTGVELYNQLADSATGGRASGTSHEKLKFVKCVVIPRQLSCSHKAIARLTFDVIGISSDGTTHPCTLTSGVALPTIAGVSEQFTLGPLTINGTAYEGIQELTIDFGIREAMKSGGGDCYPKAVVFENIVQKITLRTDDKALLAALSVTALAQTSTDSVIYLAKCASNGTRVANATTEHISFTIDEGMWMATEKSAQHPGTAMTSFEIEPIYDGTNAPIAVSVAAALP
jgi:hypothetical protein